MVMTTPQIDWDEVEQEATRLLCEYITLDTSNPPGNEEIACRWFAEILQREGISSTYYESAPGRGSLIARLPGVGSTGPLMLLNHTDVVPAQPEYWSAPPFAGEIRDGYIWGRGALDMKGLGIIELMTFLLVKRLDLPLARDLIFFAIADEEAGGEFGVEWFARQHPELLQADCVINEGAGGMLGFKGSDLPIFGFAAAEKSPLWLRLSSEGQPGHGSVPHAENALDRLVRALKRIQDWKRPRRLTPEVMPFLQGLAEAGILESIEDVETAERLAENDLLLNALTTDTISLTSVSGGVKVNVIPARAEATLDCRLLPGRDLSAFTEELRHVIDDPRVEIERIFGTEGPSSSLDHELIRTVQAVVREQIEEAVVLPMVCVGFTDSRVFRQLGVPAYGFSPTLTSEEERRTIHGHDERTPIEGLRTGTQIMFEVVRRMTAPAR
jgi:acetylornithine deacetylase/succinyl-diaminopimelate desuccinylase-like protein